MYSGIHPTVSPNFSATAVPDSHSSSLTAGRNSETLQGIILLRLRYKHAERVNYGGLIGSLLLLSVLYVQQCWLVGRPRLKYLKNIGRVARTFCTHIHGPQRMERTLVIPSHFLYHQHEVHIYGIKGHNNFWIDCHENCYKRSCPTEGEW